MKAQIPWLRVFVEGVVIVASILLAFGIQAWWEETQERTEEREIIERLISDVQADIQGIEGGLNALRPKEQSLSRVDSVLGESDARPRDPVLFLGDVINGAQYGWNQYGTRRTTFDELLGSGTFSLIRDTELRESTSSYYAAHLTAQNRIDERERPNTPTSRTGLSLAPRSLNWPLVSPKHRLNAWPVEYLSHR